MRTIVGLVLAAAVSMPALAETSYKTFKFKPNTVLEVGTDVVGGLRLDSIEFQVPADGDTSPGSFTQPKVKIAVSNLGKESVKVGLILALLDEEGRLVGVASGGTRLFPLRPERQMTYSLSFNDVHADAAKATLFKISISATP